MRNATLFLISLFACFVACTPVQHISKTQITYIETGKEPVTPDAEISAIVAPYRAQLEASMNEVVGQLGTELIKQQPESTMGNWVTDAIMKEIDHQGKYKADFAVSNYGGIRVPSITPGPLTVGEIFELAPFDNAIVIVETPGKLVDSLFQLIGGRGGWPVSKGLRIVMQENMVKSMTLHGVAIEHHKTYRIAMPDYVANGGDDAKFLIALPREQTGLVLRDALIAVAKRTSQEGHAITSTLEGRIIKM